MKVAAIVQARMGSSRLPGKVLLDLGGETVLARVINRLRRAKLLDDIVIATTQAAADDAIVRECDRLSVSTFRGSEGDVLDRYYQAAKVREPEIIVRITSDCPLIDPILVDSTITVFIDERADYASNTIVPTYPRGLDTEVFSRNALGRAWSGAHRPYEREHVTPYLYQHPELFRIASTHAPIDYSHFRWTLDTPEDLQLIRRIYSRFSNQDSFGWEEVVTLMEREPELGALNSHILQKSLYGV
jgi:spore coat polysaccharide biosynthesis protein SpsF